MIDTKRLCIVIVALLAIQGCSSAELLEDNDFDQTKSAATKRDLGGLPWDKSNTHEVADTTALVMRYGSTVGIGDFNGDGKTDIASSVMPENQPGMLDINWANGKHDRYAIKPDATKPDRFGHKLITGKFCPSLGATGDMILASAPDYGTGNGGFGIFYRKNKVFKTWRRLTGPTANEHIGTQFAIGDIDGDGNTDLVYQATPKGGSSYIGVQYDFCSVNGTIDVSHKYSSGKHVGDVLNIARLNDMPELVAADNDAHTIEFLTVGGDGSFSAARPSFKTEARVSAIEFADLDGDGMLDMIVAEPDYLSEDHAGRITAYRNPGKGKAFDANDILWQTRGGSVNAQLGESIVLSDVNDDGFVDLVASAPRTSASEPGLVFVYMGTMDGSVFSPAYWGEQGDSVGFGSALAVGDINKSGWLDIAVGSPLQGENGTVMTFLQTEATCYSASKCLVDGQCYDAGDMGENACAICNPNENNFAFTEPTCQAPENACQIAVCDPQIGCTTANAKDGTSCGEPYCSSETTSMIHACYDGVCTEKKKSCNAYVCSEDSGTCYRKCTSDDICTDGYLCRATLNMCVDKSYNHAPASYGVLYGSISGTETNYNMTISSEEELCYNGKASYDPDFDPLTYKWQCFVNKFLPPYFMGSELVFESDSSSGCTDAIQKVGNYFCTLVVNDGHVDSDQKMIAFTVFDPNNAAPVARIRARTNAMETNYRLVTTLGSTVTLSGAKSYDPDGDAMTFEWQIKRLASAVQPEFELYLDGEEVDWVPELPGDYTVQLKVTDAVGNSSVASLTVQINVENNEPPVVVAQVSPW